MSDDHIDITQLPWPGTIIEAGYERDQGDDYAFVVVRISPKIVLTIDNSVKNATICIGVREYIQDPPSWHGAVNGLTIDGDFIETDSQLAALAIAHDLFNKHNTITA